MKKCRICKSKNLITKFEYKKKPDKETIYKNLNYKNYFRFYKKCQFCKHFSAKISFNIKNLYSSEYNNSVYSGDLKKNFEKINNLPNYKSDNFYRVKRINSYIKKNFKFKKNKKLKLLDIGSGLGIFPFKMKNKKYSITALDPDKKSCAHMKKNLKLKTINADFLKLNFKKKFDFITLNKVLEHVINPKKFLLKIKSILENDGFLYVEVPSIEAAREGKYREEFFIEHLHVFSEESFRYLARSLNMKINLIKSLQEPSSKYTIYAFVSK